MSYNLLAKKGQCEIRLGCIRLKFAISLTNKKRNSEKIPLWLKSIVEKYQFCLRDYSNNHWVLVFVFLLDIVCFF